jgi:hypothetical protein
MGNEKITINDRTVKSLKAYLEKFNDDAELVFVNWNSEKGETEEFRVQICCNFEYQKSHNVAMLMRGDRLKRKKITTGGINQDQIERIASGKRAPRKPSVLSEIKNIQTYEDWKQFFKKHELQMIAELIYLA